MREKYLLDTCALNALKSFMLNLKINLDGLAKEVDKFPTLIEKGEQSIEPVAVGAAYVN
jgi:hypothetical protein